MINWEKCFAIAMLSFIMVLGIGNSAFHGSVASADEEIESYVIANVQMGEETQRVLSLLEGPLGSSTFFSYQTDADYSGVKLCCDTYVDGQKIAEEVLIDFEFAETLYVEPRRGDLFISYAHRYTTLNETCFKDEEVWDKDGSVIEVLEHRAHIRWDTGTFPRVGDTFIAPVYQACFPVKEAAKVEKGVPVKLLLMVESTESDGASLFRKTAQELLDNPEVLGVSLFYVFYCIFR